MPDTTHPDALAALLHELGLNCEYDAPYGREHHDSDAERLRSAGVLTSADPFTTYQGACGHLWKYRGDPNDCPVCNEIAGLRTFAQQEHQRADEAVEKARLEFNIGRRMQRAAIAAPAPALDAERLRRERTAGLRDALIAVGMLNGDGRNEPRDPALDAAEEAIRRLIASAERAEGRS